MLRTRNLALGSAVVHTRIQTGPVNGRFSISFSSFDMNLIEIYFIAIVLCVYFGTFSLILCIFMINVFYLYKC